MSPVLSRAVRSLVAVVGLVLFGGIVMTIGVSPATACTCSLESYDRPVEQTVEQTSAIFEGVVSEIEGDDLGTTITVDVTRVWKGDVADTVTVATGAGQGDCGVETVVGERRVWLPSGEGEDLDIRACGGGATPADLDRILGSPRVLSPEEDGTSYLWPGIFTGLALGIGVAAYVVLVRRA